jgi:GH24 family phage-related lysozyme (muramidase)
MISKRGVLEIITHEGLVREAYKDSRGIWTWGIGVTSASGHEVERYIDNPQPISRVIEIFEWLLREKYLPSVEQAFRGLVLTDTQLAGALSFHYNTGAIQRASWVKKWKRGDFSGAYDAFMHWRRPKEIAPRREKERALFFKGVWSGRGEVIEYPVKRSTHTPDWGKARRVDISDSLDKVFGT